jgi:hypothetical protein
MTDDTARSDDADRCAASGTTGDPHRDPLADPRVQAGVEHLQRAAREVIAASRSLLDAAEDLVEDPRAAGTVLEVLSSLAARGRSGVVDGVVRGASAPDRDADDGGDGGPVQRIPVS